MCLGASVCDRDSVKLETDEVSLNVVEILLYLRSFNVLSLPAAMSFKLSRQLLLVLVTALLIFVSTFHHHFRWSLEGVPIQSLLAPL